MYGYFVGEFYKYFRFVVNILICEIIDRSICFSYKRYRIILEIYEIVLCCIYVVDVIVVVRINGILYRMGFFILK